MRAAIRLELSKKDEEALLEKVDNYVGVLCNNVTSVDPRETRQEIITFYRSQLHKVFKMGLSANPTTTQIED